MKLPGTMEITETQSGLRLQMSIEMFNAIYRLTKFQSKKARQRRKQVKMLINKALRAYGESHEAKED